MKDETYRQMKEALGRFEREFPKALAEDRRRHRRNTRIGVAVIISPAVILSLILVYKALFG